MRRRLDNAVVLSFGGEELESREVSGSKDHVAAGRRPCDKLCSVEHAEIVRLCSLLTDLEEVRAMVPR